MTWGKLARFITLKLSLGLFFLTLFYSEPRKTLENKFYALLTLPFETANSIQMTSQLSVEVVAHYCHLV